MCPIVDLAARLIVPVLAPFYSRAASRGIGSDACLRWGFLPVPVNCYSPVPDLPALERRKVWDRRSDLAGIAFASERQLEFLDRLGGEYGEECDWPAHAATGDRFSTESGTFGFGCAASTHTIIRSFKPRRVIEIGSGQSSKVIAAALCLNAENSGVAANYTIIDPCPGPSIDRGMPGMTRLLKRGVECQEMGLFEQLEANDVLFIDSGHTVRIGGDVNFLILDVLPRLAPGVIVHFHDIGLPYEYPKIYAVNPSFRVFWTEAYLLQAFLCFNAEYEVLSALAYLMAEQKEAFRSAFPHYDPMRHVSISGSFWIRRKAGRSQ